MANTPRGRRGSIRPYTASSQPATKESLVGTQEAIEGETRIGETRMARLPGSQSPSFLIQPV